MPDKAKLKRRRTQPQRDKARNRREEQAEAEAESGRRLAQSQRDKARRRRETQEEITRIAVAVQRQLALVRQPSSPAAKPEVHTSTVSLITIMEKRSAEFMQNIARYLSLGLLLFHLTSTDCSTTRDTPMLPLSSMAKVYLFTNVCLHAKRISGKGISGLVC